VSSKGQALRWKDMIWRQPLAFFPSKPSILFHRAQIPTQYIKATTNGSRLRMLCRKRPGSKLNLVFDEPDIIDLEHVAWLRECVSTIVRRVPHRTSKHPGRQTIDSSRCVIEIVVLLRVELLLTTLHLSTAPCLLVCRQLI
jgi:hypothetical protein